MKLNQGLQSWPINAQCSRHIHISWYLRFTIFFKTHSQATFPTIFPRHRPWKISLSHPMTYCLVITDGFYSFRIKPVDFAKPAKKKAIMSSGFLNTSIFLLMGNMCIYIYIHIDLLNLTYPIESNLQWCLIWFNLINLTFSPFFMVKSHSLPPRHRPRRLRPLWLPGKDQLWRTWIRMVCQMAKDSEGTYIDGK